MSKRKDSEIKQRPLMGRVGTNLRIGIVGLPNVGKSTFFNVLTKSQIPAENFPFCTIDPNESRVPVPDERFDWLCEYHQPNSRVPAFLNVMDIAGLVEGAHEGKGLGNAFLSHISGCDAIFNMVRVFDDIEVTHVEGDVDPIRDLKIIAEELRMKDEEYIIREYEKLEKLHIRGNNKKLRGDYEAMKRVLKLVVDEHKPVRDGDWNDSEIELLNHHLFLTAKPIIYLINMSKKDYIRKKTKWLPKIVEWIREHDSNSAAVIPFSAEFEAEWQDLSQAERVQFCSDNGDVGSALGKIIKQGYSCLQLHYFFTCGKDEVKAWTIQKGYKAPQAAGKIHSDMEKGFIMAEVMTFEDFKELGSENAVKAAGKYKQKGREYLVEDGDIIFFRFNAGAGLTCSKK